MRVLLYCLTAILMGIGIEWSISSLDYLNLVQGEDIQVLIPHMKVKLKLDHLPAGSYFISAARPRGRCSIKIDNQIAATNYSNDAERDQLFLFTGFVQDPLARKSEALIECETRAGVKSTLGSFPLVQTHSLGIVIQSIREFSQVYLGPISLLLAFLVYFLLSFRGAVRKESLFLWMLVSSLLYMISLTHYLNLFMESTSAAMAHYVIRNLFAMNLVACFVPVRLRSRVLPVLALPVFLSLTLQFVLSPEVYVRFYDFEVLVFGITFFWIGYKKAGERDRETAFLSSALIVYGLYHGNSYFPFINFETVNSLGMLFPVAIISCQIYSKWSEYRRWLLLKTFDNEIDALIRRAIKEEEVFQLFHEKMKAMFARYFSLNMKEAAELHQQATREKIRNIPKFDRFRFFRFYQSKRAVVRSHLELLELRDGYRMGAKLRPFYRGHETRLKISVLVLDINNYAKQLSHYGPPYADFISQAFLPKLGVFFEEHGGIIEAVNGDEMVVIFLSSIQSSKEEFAEKTSQLLLGLQHFLIVDQLRLSQEFTFPLQTISAGLATEVGSLTKESGRFHLKNPPNSRAKRIASAATSESILMDEETRGPLEDYSEIQMGERFPVLVKKDFIEVSEVIGLKTAA